MDQLFDTKREIDSRLCYVELTPSDLTLVEQFKTRFNKVIDDTTEKIDALTTKDKELGLYSLAPNKSKDSICHPKVFSCKVEENVHQFITEFKTALQADHVRKKDEVNTLMKYLDSHAKMSVGTHTQTLDEAIEILK